MIKKLITWIQVKLAERRKKKAFKDSLERYKKQDPFNYKNF